MLYFDDIKVNCNGTRPRKQKAVSHGMEARKS